MKKSFFPLSLFVLFVVFAGVIVLVTYQLSTRANSIVLEGDKLVQENKAEDALLMYDRALKRWPLIRFTTSYKKRVAYAQGLVEFYQEIPSVVIFLTDEVKQEEIDTFTKQLELISGFDRIDFLTKEDAYTKYENRVTGELSEELFSFVSPEDLFLTIEVYLDEPSLSWKIVQLAESMDFVYQAMEVN